MSIREEAIILESVEFSKTYMEKWPSEGKNAPDGSSHTTGLNDVIYRYVEHHKNGVK